jgi:hypothetical protein
MDDDPVLRLDRWDGSWPADDPDANFKADVALYAKVDPLVTLAGLSGRTGIPVGALARYVLARWASAGSESLLSASPSVIERLGQVCESADAANTDAARLDAYDTLRQMISWLRTPIEEVLDGPEPESTT